MPVLLGVLRYLTTRYRVADGRVELRRGLLSRKVTSTPLDRVRTVDLTASVIHRVLGLTTLRIGTGLATADDGDALDLDGLPVDRARALRADLLRVGPRDDAVERRARGPVAERGAGGVRPAVAAVRPFTGTGLVVVAATLGGASQLLEALDVWDDLRSEDLPVASVVGVALAAVVGARRAARRCRCWATWSPTAGSGSTRAAGAWHVRPRPAHHPRDQHRRGPAGRGRARRAARPCAWPAAATCRRSSPASTAPRPAARRSVPPSDAAVAPGAARTLLGTAAPVDAALVGHGPAAARRRWTRALVPAGAVVALAVVVPLAGGPWWPLVPALLLLVAAAASRPTGSPGSATPSSTATSSPAPAA